MSRKKLSQYAGSLDAAQIAQGINAARRNARRLAEDAKLLLETARYPSATALAILSIGHLEKCLVDSHRWREWQFAGMSVRK